MNPTATQTVTREAVYSAMQNLGVAGTYGSYAGSLADHLNRRGVRASEVTSFARQQGGRVSDSEAQRLVDRLTPATPAAASTSGSSVGSIRETVINSLPAEARRYTNYAEPVITALEERERTMAEGIIEAAVEDGISRDDVLATIRNVGLTAPTFEVTGAAHDEEAPGWARAILDRLGSLEQIARDRGLLPR